jgi:hypothetical protein
MSEFLLIPVEAGAQLAAQVRAWIHKDYDVSYPKDDCRLKPMGIVRGWRGGGDYFVFAASKLRFTTNIMNELFPGLAYLDTHKDDFPKDALELFDLCSAARSDRLDVHCRLLDLSNEQYAYEVAADTVAENALMRDGSIRSRCAELLRDAGRLIPEAKRIKRAETEMAALVTALEHNRRHTDEAERLRRENERLRRKLEDSSVRSPAPANDA